VPAGTPISLNVPEVFPSGTARFGVSDMFRVLSARVAAANARAPPIAATTLAARIDFAATGAAVIKLGFIGELMEFDCWE
jgi:hypothetical protein